MIETLFVLTDIDAMDTNDAGLSTRIEDYAVKVRYGNSYDSRNRTIIENVAAILEDMFERIYNEEDIHVVRYADKFIDFLCNVKIMRVIERRNNYLHVPNNRPF